MKNPNIILLGIVSILMLVGVNASEVGHPAEEIGAGVFTAGDFTFQGNVFLKLDNEVFLSLGNLEGSAREWALVSTGSSGGMGTGKFSIFDRTAGVSRLLIDENGFIEISGELKFGNSGLDCDENSEGALRYNPNDKVMEYCDGTEWKGFGGTAGPIDLLNYIEFTTSGTYTPPEGLSYIEVEVVGAGGKGGPIAGTFEPGGGGGGSGAWAKNRFESEDLGSIEIEIIVGTGADGIDTSFGSFIISGAGKNGAIGSDNRVGKRGGGGAGGIVSEGAAGAQVFNGVKGSDGQFPNEAGNGGGGGGASSYDNTLGHTDDEGNPVFYGAGGSGGSSNNRWPVSQPGNGQPGIVRIWEYGT